MTVLKIALREAAAIGLIPANPAVGLRLPAQRRAPSPTWSLDEASRVIAAVADEPMWNALYRLALASGMRSGELRALRWSDVREADGLVRVRRTISRAAAQPPETEGASIENQPCAIDGCQGVCQGSWVGFSIRRYGVPLCSKHSALAKRGEIDAELEALNAAAR